MKNWKIQVIKFGVGQKTITSTFLRYRAAELFYLKSSSFGLKEILYYSISMVG